VIFQVQKSLFSAFLLKQPSTALPREEKHKKTAPRCRDAVGNQLK
jgi:hypothetical protein